MSSAVNQPIQRLRRHSIASLSVGSNSLVMVPEQTEMQAQAFQNRRPSTPTSPALALRRQQKQQQQHQQQQIYHNGVGAASAAADNNNNEMFNSNGMSVGSLYSSRNGEEEKTDEADLTHIPQTYATGFIPETSATASPPGSSHDSSSSSNDYNMVRSNSSSSSSTSPISSVPTAKQFILFHDPASAKSSRKRWWCDVVKIPFVYPHRFFLVKVLDYLRRNIPAGCQLAVDIGASINERQLKLIAHCVDTQELKEWVIEKYTCVYILSHTISSSLFFLSPLSVPWGILLTPR